MSGIAGWVAFDDDLSKRHNEIEQMTETMVRRGPDGGGTWVSRHAALGQRRRSVIDVPGDQQPMELKTPAGSVVIVYSGRIFNLRELRGELESRGCSFRTDSEAEVVLRAYLEWDEDMTDRLNGTYAFALWDERKTKLVLIRDRIGIKPLYYHPTSGGVLFGSEPKAILRNALFKRVVDTSCLRELVGFTKAPGWSLW
ncbi:MAG TPA: asparagine synthetase B, partial [Polyangiaceae bacterium]